MNSTRWKVLVSAPYLQPELERFRPLFAENGIELMVPPVRERLSEEELLACIAEIDGVICGDDRFSRRVLTEAKRLKVISKWGTGIDSIDREACKQLGIALCNTPNAFSEPVADSVLGYILCFARQLPFMADDIRRGLWSKRPSVSLRETTLGIFGVGNVGQAVARRAQAFGMRILGCDPVVPAQKFREFTGLEMVDKASLLQQSDFISLNCDLNETSFHLMSDADFARVKPGAVLINTSRGPVVDEPALVRALKAGRLAGAGLDVFEEEPLPAGSPLRELPNVLMAPHNSNGSPQAYERVHQNTIGNLLRVLREARS